MTRRAKILSPADLRKGMTAEFEREVTEADVMAYAEVSGDFNPLHVDAKYAESTSFGGRIAHGALQVGIASEMIGMHLPGQYVLLGTVSARFPEPLKFPTRIRAHGEIVAWNLESLAGRLRVTVVDLAIQSPTAEIEMAFTVREPRETVESEGRAETSRSSGDLPVVLVTGASGGIGGAITERLAGQYHVLAQVNRNPLPERLRHNPDVAEIRLNFADTDWLRDFSRQTENMRLYGVVHAAWPGAPRGGLLGSPAEVLQHQLFFGTTCLVDLAKLLRDRVEDDGGRLIAIGSTAGLEHPNIALGTYSLGKGALEQTVRLLAPELARKNITANTVRPSFVPIGMHDQVTDDRRLKLETASVPMGRLCEPDDIISTVEFLLSEQSGFISGQALSLTGGQI